MPAKKNTEFRIVSTPPKSDTKMRGPPARQLVNHLLQRSYEEEWTSKAIIYSIRRQEKT